MVLDFNSRNTLGDRFVSLIDEAIEAEPQGRRDYLGGSLIGEPCARRLQYEYLVERREERRVLGQLHVRLVRRHLRGVLRIRLGDAVLDQLAEHPAFFTALNADTMEIHLELIPFDQSLAQECADKAARIFTACDHEEVLPRITDDPASFVCRFCPYQGVCWNA